MRYLMPLAALATTPKEKLFGLAVVLGLSTIILFSFGFLAMALVVNRNMRAAEDQSTPKPKTRAPDTHV
jgi:hypothetical protein